MKKILLVLSLFLTLPLLAYKYDFSLCMVFRDEAPYLKEWIEFHRLLGVEHFYLYNNLSNDHYQEVLQSYIDDKIVELIDWPYPSENISEWDVVQISAYNDGFAKARSKTKWLAFLDCDEFLFPTQSDDLREFLKGYEKIPRIGGVCVNWVVYGTSGVMKIPENQLLIETLVLSSGSGSDHFKTIFRPKRAAFVSSPHFVTYKSGYYHCTPSNKPVHPPFVETDKIRINHYWTRDEWFLNNFKIPRRLKWGTSSEVCIDWAQHSNNVLDESIFRFIEPLRKRLRKQ